MKNGPVSTSQGIHRDGSGTLQFTGHSRTGGGRCDPHLFLLRHEFVAASQHGGGFQRGVLGMLRVCPVVCGVLALLFRRFVSLSPTIDLVLFFDDGIALCHYPVTELWRRTRGVSNIW